jgi:glycyl-tRNA synthetase alpha subunit
MKHAYRNRMGVNWPKSKEHLVHSEVLWNGQSQEQGDAEYELCSQAVKVAVLKKAEACSSCIKQKTSFTAVKDVIENSRVHSLMDSGMDKTIRLTCISKQNTVKCREKWQRNRCKNRPKFPCSIVAF